jgi:hypothetical protein
MVFESHSGKCFILVFSMKRSGPVVGVLLGLLPLLLAVELPFEAGKLLDIQKKAHSRVLYYLVNTPVTQDDPYYEVSVQVKDIVYVADFTPVHAKQTLPDDWQLEGTIQVQVEKHRLILKQPGETELQLVIVKQMAATPGTSAPSPAPSKQ